MDFAAVVLKEEDYMDDLGGFIVGLLVFFVMVYAIITILAYLLMAATVAVPAFFLIRHLVRQLRDRYILADWAKAALIINAAISLIIGALVVYLRDLSGYLSILIALSIFLITTPALLNLWAETAIRPFRLVRQEAEDLLIKIRGDLTSLNDHINTVKREIQDMESRYAGQIHLRESWSAKVDDLCLCSGQDYRFMLVARDKLEAQIASLSTMEMEKRIEKLERHTKDDHAEKMDRLEIGLLQITLLDRQTKGATKGALKARQGHLESLEDKAASVQKLLEQQEQVVAHAKQILDGFSTQKIVLG
jgi:hypothetical protein